MLMEKDVKSFVESVASKSPAPGGGSVSALASSLGSALTSMVGNLTIGKKRYEKLDEEKKELINKNLEKANLLVEELNVLVQKDTTAFNGVMDAFKLPKETEEDKKHRKNAIEEATKEALLVPLEVAEKSLEVLKLQKVFAEDGNPNAITDIGVGALLAYTGLEGALFNVLINLSGISDESFVKEIKEKCNNLKNEGNDLKEESIKIVYSKL